ncbi:uncharacterized protein LOC125316584 [Rhodamnia argentea]|uniref:Uncharacterized protein LOC125316584 n=1 Tax=Rhodamnia argentea TaxID=178133 RepID=A0ABM3HXB9_9MYRT|nr:uncharacterized protein LOC125316584 [Rhodamnia argentea]
MQIMACWPSIKKFLNLLFGHELKDDEHRNYLLVVATLIAAVTFQAGVNPPGGVWQDGVKAGRAIYASDETAFFVFLLCNTLALSSSTLLILSLTWGFPFFLEVVVATASMLMTYGASIFAIAPRDTKTVKFRYLLSIAAAPVLMRVVILICKYVKSKL